MAAGKPALRKLLTATEEGCKRIIETELARGKPLVQVRYLCRYYERYHALKEIILNSKLGEPLMVHLGENEKRTTSDMSSQNERGIMLFWACYPICILIGHCRSPLLHMQLILFVYEHSLANISLFDVLKQLMLTAYNGEQAGVSNKQENRLLVICHWR